MSAPVTTANGARLELLQLEDWLLDYTLDFCDLPRFEFPLSRVCRRLNAAVSRKIGARAPVLPAPSRIAEYENLLNYVLAIRGTKFPLALSEAEVEEIYARDAPLALANLRVWGCSNPRVTVTDAALAGAERCARSAAVTGLPFFNNTPHRNIPFEVKLHLAELSVLCPTTTEFDIIASGRDYFRVEEVLVAAASVGAERLRYAVNVLKTHDKYWTLDAQIPNEVHQAAIQAGSIACLQYLAEEGNAVDILRAVCRSGNLRLLREFVAYFKDSGALLTTSDAANAATEVMESQSAECIAHFREAILEPLFAGQLKLRDGGYPPLIGKDVATRLKYFDLDVCRRVSKETAFKFGCLCRNVTVAAAIANSNPKLVALAVTRGRRLTRHHYVQFLRADDPRYLEELHKAGIRLHRDIVALCFQADAARCLRFVGELLPHALRGVTEHAAVGPKCLAYLKTREAHNRRGGAVK